MRLLTGTSGFAYKEWRGEFYPTDLSAAGMLRYYAERFGSVEINNTFYRIPTESVLEQWASEVPEDFTFVLKAPQSITHRRRLKETEEPATFFFERARVLGEKLGPILVQLPPNLKKDLPRLETFLKIVPPDLRVAFEFRNSSWFEDDLYALLRDHGAVLCIAHGEKIETPLVATADWGYVRLRQVSYEGSALEEWAGAVAAQPWNEAFVFFKHEDSGTGPKLAHRFEEIFTPGQS